MSGSKWTEDELFYLTHNIKSRTYKELADRLGRSVDSVKHKVYSLGIKDKAPRTFKPWSDKEINYLVENYNKKSTADIAKRLGRSINSIQQASRRHGADGRKADGYTMGEIASAFQSTKELPMRWYEKYKAPFKKMQVGKGVYYNIIGEDFWKWAEKHKGIVPIKKYIPLTILPEPKNFSKEGWKAEPVRSRKKFTHTELMRIEVLWKSGYTAKRIASEVGRSVYSIKHVLQKGFR